MDADRFFSHSLQDPRIPAILASALGAVDPARLVEAHLASRTLPEHDRLFLLGIGKAAEPMTLAAARILPNFTEAIIITKHAFSKTLGGIRLLEGGHPIPDEGSLAAGRAALDFVSRLRGSDLLVCLLSGGASALATAPRGGITLKETQALTSLLLARGATIEEMNCTRRDWDRIKGGGLARSTSGKVLSLILSDVLGDRLEVIASGPTTPNPTTREDAMRILKKYAAEEEIPDSIRRSLQGPKATDDDPVFRRVQNVVIGNNSLALQAAMERAQQEGFEAEIIETSLAGEARDAGRRLGRLLKTRRSGIGHSFCLIAGGETTVTLKGTGKGGRNQELALAAVDELAGVPGTLLVSLASDGDDGPTDAAGAVVTGDSARRASEAGAHASEYLSRNDAYPFFELLGDLLRPGYTGTNVNDLILLIGL